MTVSWTELADGRSMLRYRVDGCRQLYVPEFAGVGRADGLWQTTCFELFLQTPDGGYREFNFSPSQRWAAYAFPAYRERSGNCEEIAPPVIASQRGDKIFTCTVFLDRNCLQVATRAGLSAVIEEIDGHKSFWALAHPEGEPDFHDPACFALELG